MSKANFFIFLFFIKNWKSFIKNNFQVSIECEWTVNWKPSVHRKIVRGNRMASQHYNINIQKHFWNIVLKWINLIELWRLNEMFYYIQITEQCWWKFSWIRLNINISSRNLRFLLIKKFSIFFQLKFNITT